ncbi:exosome complex protein Rrp42 [Sulfuracidifex tepidarius]|uniref:Exosome complex component Rrp42 n=1 Tax=Sulfuracidifex tepidarius TaxID=1294262 RepID=A0A510E3S6_9CREN|nr:exosome complex protein Rrp42 [Sulfuracidifex tepidarius]BBG24415.1 Exosome complex component Rrp42 [Sulfuracidifex tepidarius]BBG27173.1 Exosome complex component Rrp42 [Sulfuracidifex tepidarius]
MSITPSNQNIIPAIKRESILNILEHGSRTDGRKLGDYRNIQASLGYAKKADGSCLLKLGETMVLAGVKLETEEPFQDTPNQGNLVVNVELLPLAYETFEPGPPDENAIELARVVDRSLRDSKAVDLTRLVLVPGKQIWTAWVDIYILNYSGNVLDASTLASICALYDTKLPSIIQGDNGISINKEEKNEKFPLNYPVVSVTVAKIGKFLVVDPNLEEESIADAKISISYTPDFRIVGMQKSGNGTFSVDEINNAENMARSTAEKLFGELKNLLGIDFGEMKHG